ncbi:hypothetical protein M3226_02555 [Neobacillus cucumis]|uniref:hypothetical protein n=1 Tax=Neobacillus cucumis TaxID=1740721 RepID=UPI00203B6A4C|nr:hypothetical protein [Neobacillus cucumis]MCM3724583.1 hypothetical protein [Neobacillus cucumis]
MDKAKVGQVQANAFLDALFGNVQQGFITLWTSVDKKTRWYRVNDLKNINQNAINLGENCNVYFGVGVRRNKLGEYKRGKNEDVLFLPGVWVEIDLNGGVHAADKLPSEEDAQVILNTFPLKPSIIIHSGGGLHCYWLFQEPFRIQSDQEMHVVGRLLENFQRVFIQLAKLKGFHIDNTSDLARVLRVPGTFNLKSRNNPKPVTIQLFEPNRRYSIFEINKVIQMLVPSLTIEQKAKAQKKIYSGEAIAVTNPNRIIQECRFIGSYLNHKETANYNNWLAALSIAAYCENGHDLVHEWSKGHPDYVERVVVRKYIEIRRNMKPRTCRSLSQEFDGCGGCIHLNKINSPIVLGMERKLHCHQGKSTSEKQI